LVALRAEAAPADASPQPALRENVARAVRRYLADIEDHEVDDLYDVVLREIEAPLFAEVLRHCAGNQTRAAATLGINRATLRKKLRQYRLA
jgi:Fis family transcriptional regulator